MDPPELTNFGSLVRYALGLEADTAAFYREAARLLGPGKSAATIQGLAEAHDARRSLLERTRQQKLNEMVLEPITELDGARYVYEASVPSVAEVRRTALALEETAARLYGESAVVAQALLTEAARTFRKLADQNADNIARIRAAFPAGAQGGPSV